MGRFAPKSGLLASSQSLRVSGRGKRFHGPGRVGAPGYVTMHPLEFSLSRGPWGLPCTGSFTRGVPFLVPGYVAWNVIAALQNETHSFARHPFYI